MSCQPSTDTTSALTVPCVNCTFLNVASRVRCAVCNLNIRKRRRPSASQEHSSPANSQLSAPVSADSPSGDATTAAARASSGIRRRRSTPCRSDGEGTSRRNGSQGSPPTSQTFQACHSGSTAPSVALPDLLSASPRPAFKRGSGLLKESLATTMFSTGLGNPVAVSRSSLRAAVKKFSDAGIDGDSEPPLAGEALSRSPPAGSMPSSVARFSNVSRMSHEEHQKGRDEGEQAGTRATTLFFTASGKSVSVSRASLASAASKFDLAMPGAEETPSPSSTPVHHDDGERPPHLPTPGPDTATTKQHRVERRTTPPLRAATGGVGTVNVGLVSNQAGLPHSSGKRGFVAPRLTTSLSTSTTYNRTAAVVLHPGLVAPVNSRSIATSAAQEHTTAATKVGQSSLRPLRLNVFDFVSDSMVHIPHGDDVAAEVATGSFTFSTTQCSPSLLRLMGVDAGETVVEAKHYRQALLALGAAVAGCTPQWCSHMYSVVVQVLFDLRTRCVPAVEKVFDPAFLLLLLVHRYNQEHVEGQRSVLRRVIERDVPATVPMVLRVIEVLQEERLSPHTRIARVTDGWYTVKASLDVPLTNLVRGNVLRNSDTILVSGSKLLLSSAMSPLDIGPSTPCAISLFFNSVRPVAAEAHLGLLAVSPPAFPIAAVHPLGGVVSAVRCVVLRQLAAFYVETVRLPESSSSCVAGIARGTPVNTARRIVRSAHSEERVAEEQQRKCRELYDLVSERMSENEAVEHVRSQCARFVSRVSSFLVADAENGEALALVQVWQDDRSCINRGLLDLEPLDIPAEGATVDLYGLSPAKSQTAPVPFQNAKLLYTRPPLQIRQVACSIPAKPPGLLRTFFDAPEGLERLSTGAVVDLLLFFIDTRSTSKGTVLVFSFAKDRNVFAALEVPFLAGFKELQLGVPSGTDPSPVALEHATFARIDESGPFTAVRLVCSEYTQLRQRPPQKALQEALKAIDAIQRGLSNTQRAELVQNGRACLDSCFQSSSDRLRPSYPDQSFEAVTYESSGGQRNAAVTCSTSEEVARPHDLEAASRCAIGAPTAGLASATAPGGGTQGRLPYYLRDNHSRNGSRTFGVVIKPQSTMETSLKVMAGGDMGAVKANGRSVHAFGNLTELLIGERCTSGSGSSGHVGEVMNPKDTFMHAEVILGWPPESESSAMAGEKAPDLWCAFDFLKGDNGGTSHRVEFRDGPAGLAMLCDECCELSIKHLCALAIDEENVEFSLQRARVIRRIEEGDVAASSAAPSEESGVARWNWWELLRRSVVVPHTLLRQLEKDVDAAGKGEGRYATESRVLTLLTRGTNIRRWNYRIVPKGQDALWWLEEEWNVIRDALISNLTNVLYKVTLDSRARLLRRVFRLKERCPIENLYDDSNDDDEGETAA